MHSVDANSRTQAAPVDMKLEVVLLGVSDVDRAKAFYQILGWRLDIDVAAGGFRGVQMTPHNSFASIVFGKGITSGTPAVIPFARASAAYTGGVRQRRGRGKLVVTVAEAS